jgi:hypothetical protein
MTPIRYLEVDFLQLPKAIGFQAMELNHPSPLCFDAEHGQDLSGYLI